MFWVILSFNHVKAIGNDVGMLHAPRQRLDLLNGDVSTKVVNLSLRVLAISLETREVKQLGSIIDLLPEALLHLLLCLSQLLIKLEVVQVS